MDEKKTECGVVCCPRNLEKFSYILYVAFIFELWQEGMNFDGEGIFSFLFLFIRLIMLVVFFASCRKVNKKTLKDPEKFLKKLKRYSCILLVFFGLHVIFSVVCSIIGVIILAIDGSLADMIQLGDFLALISSVLEGVGIVGVVLMLRKGEIKRDEESPVEPAVTEEPADPVVTEEPAEPEN